MVKEDIKYLMPSAIFVSAQMDKVQTILGSCVAVCMYDLSAGVGGMNHFMLPYWNGVGLATPKYGNIAIETLYLKLIAAGAHPGKILAKVFGGGNVLNFTAGVKGIGERNYELAFSILSKYNIPVVGSSVGGDYGRKIIFESHSGIVMQKSIGRIDINFDLLPDAKLQDVI